MEFITLPVSKIHRETPDAVSLYFEPPAAQAGHYRWLAGQHVKIRLNLEGETQVRHYSISAPSGDRQLRITVKAVKDGKVSRYLNKSLKEGDGLEISPPLGSFVLCPDKKARRTHYFFCAGSGITPIFSMISTVLAQEPNSVARLLYANKNHKACIFADALDKLVGQYGDRLTLEHCHSSPSWLASSPWYSGRIDKTAITRFIQTYPPYAQDVHYYLCGPGSFLADNRQVLMDLDVPQSRIHMESFGGQSSVPTEEGKTASLSVELGGQHYQLDVEAGQTLLQAMQEHQIPAPFSCEGGVCSTCQCQIVKGQVKMLNNLVLTEQDEADGQILACQSIALTNKVQIRY